MTEQSPLYACLYAREFPAQAMLRLRPELRGKACVVLQGEPPVQTVCALNAAARKAGVVRGMTRVELDTFPALVPLPRSVSEEDSAKTALLECAGGFSPRVEEYVERDAFCCVIDIAGTEKLFGVPTVLAQTLLRRVRALGISATAIVSGNFHAAICFSRGGATRGGMAIIPTGTESMALSSLPLSVLGLAEDYAGTFASWGIHTLGMLAALPEKELIARMGQEGRRLRQLARGEHPHFFVPLEAAFRLEEHRELDSPVEQLESLLFVIGVLLEQLIVRAGARALALASVTLTLALEGAAAHTRTVRPALPSNDRQLWIKLLHLDLEAHPPSAAVLSLTVVADPGCTGKVQLGLFSPQLPEPGRLDVTLARIRAIVGDEYVGRAVLKDGHQQDAFRIEPFSVPAGQATQKAIGRARTALRRLRPAEGVTVTLSGNRPMTFYFRGTRYDAEGVYGPWLKSGDWWNPAAWGTEQWDVVARSGDGVLLCCCLVRDLRQNQWQMAGFYD